MKKALIMVINIFIVIVFNYVSICSKKKCSVLTFLIVTTCYLIFKLYLIYHSYYFSTKFESYLKFILIKKNWYGISLLFRDIILLFKIVLSCIQTRWFVFTSLIVLNSYIGFKLYLIWIRRVYFCRFFLALK